MRRRRAIVTLATLPLAVAALRPSRRAWSAGGPAPVLLADLPDGSGQVLHDRDNLYWTGKSAVFRLSKRGGKPVAIADKSLDLGAVVGGRLFFQDSPPDSTSLVDSVHSWKSMPVGGGAPTTLVTDRCWSHCAAADASGFYFMEMEREAHFFLLFHIPPSPAGAPPREVSEVSNEPGLMAVDRTHVYWIGLGGVSSVPKAGGVPEGLDSNEYGSTPDDLALDDHFVYWTEPEGEAVYRVPKKGGRQVRLVKGGMPRGLALSGRFVYYVTRDNDDTTVLRVPKEGKSKPETVIKRPGCEIQAFLADDHALYWFEATRRSGSASKRERIMRLAL